MTESRWRVLSPTGHVFCCATVQTPRGHRIELRDGDDLIRAALTEATEAAREIADR